MRIRVGIFIECFIYFFCESRMNVETLKTRILLTVIGDKVLEMPQVDRTLKYSIFDDVHINCINIFILCIIKALVVDFYKIVRQLGSSGKMLLNLCLSITRRQKSTKICFIFVLEVTKHMYFLGKI